MATEPRSRITAELLTDTPHPADVRLSPDGTRVAWVARAFGSRGEHPDSALWLAPVDGSAPARPLTRGALDTSPRWSPDGTRLAFLSDRAERGMAGLYVLRLDGGEAEPVAVRGRPVAAAEWSPDGDQLAFLAADDPTADDRRREHDRDDADVAAQRWRHQRLWVVPAAGGAPRVRAAGDAHRTALAWSPDGTRIAMLTQDTPELDAGASTVVQVADAAGSGDPVTVCAAPWAEDVHWLPDGQTLVWTAPHERVPQSSTTVWSVRARPGAAAAVVGPAVDDEVCALSVHVPPGAGDTGDAVVVAIADRLDTHLQWRHPDGRPPSALWSTTVAVEAVDVGGGEARPVLAVVRCADAGPAEVWAGSPGALVRLSDHHAAWAGIARGATEPLTVTAGDGLVIDAVLRHPAPGTPAAEAGPPYSTVVLPHGGPYGRDTLGITGHPLDWGPWLAAAGYAVLHPNYRGGSGRGNALATAVRADLGGAEWGDVLAVTDAAVRRGIADPRRLGVGGWSQGGFLTAWAVTQTDRFRAAVMGAGVSSWPSMAITSDVPSFEGALAGHLPWEGLDGPRATLAEQRSPLWHAARVRTPLLILHGERDERVPASQGVGMYRALRDAGVPLEMVTYPREPHVVAERAHLLDILARVRDWYGRWLSPEP